jgi:hypothetical protein
MTDALTEISALKQTISSARTEQARREAQADQAEAIEKDSLAKLKELGCDTPEEALAEAKKLQDKIAEQAKAIRTKIEEATSE